MPKDQLRKFKKLVRGILRTPFSTPQFRIRSGYRHRTKLRYFDARDRTDEFQKEVYEHAARIASENGLRSVLDLGCGSGFKLMKHFRHLETTGVDLSISVDALRTKYPDRSWIEVESDATKTLTGELVICADVIEHVLDPDAILAQIKAASNVKWIVLSTPDRDILRGRYDFGPPNNPCHVREWNSREFVRYVSDHFEVIDHQITHRSQGTQMAVCQPKRCSAKTATGA